LRLWAASVEFYSDVRMSDTILTRLSEAYRKLRNTFRYALGNLSDFDPHTCSAPGAELAEIDQWILIRAEALIEKCLKWYEEFAFHKIYHAAYDFATVDLSAIYFDVLKDRLYTSAPQSRARRSAQTTLYRLLHAWVRMLAPVLTFTCEEVWGHLQLPGSVHTAEFPKPADLTEGISEGQRKRSENWERLMLVRDVVLKSLEAARQSKFIGAPLEARVRLNADDDLYPLLEEYRRELPGLFIVSQVTLEKSDDVGVSVHVSRAEGAKCERCWKYTTDIGSHSDLPTICGACAAAVVEIAGMNGPE